MYLRAPKKIKEPLHVRIGVGLLFSVFFALLAGRFTLNRLVASLPDLDLRLVMAYAITIVFILWVAGARHQMTSPIAVPGGVFFFFWAAWLVSSGMWAPPESRVGDAVTDIILLMIFTGIGWAVMGLLPPEATSRIWTWMLYAGVIYFVLAMAAGPGAQGRYAAPGGGPNVFVRIMVLAALAALYVSISRRKTWPLMAVPLFVVGAALSGSRGGILSGGIVLLLFLIPIGVRLGIKKVAGILTVGAIAFGVFAWLDKGKMFAFIEERYIQQTLVEGYSSGRDVIAEQAISMYEMYPLGGAGIDGYYAFLPDFEYAHNLFLSTAAETGTVGLIFLGLAVLRFAVFTRRPRPVPLTVVFALAAGIYLILTALFSGDYYDSRFIWFFFGLAAIESRRKIGQAPVQGLPEQSVKLRDLQRGIRVDRRVGSIRH